MSDLAKTGKLKMSNQQLLRGENLFLKQDNVTQKGISRIYKFDNEYGASVIMNDISYGGKSGLYEVAVLDNGGDLCFDTKITNDVLGFLTPPEVNVILENISNLSPKT